MTAIPAIPDEADLARIVDRVRRVPSRYREFRRSRAEAEWQHKIGSGLLDALVDLGLPAEGSGDGLLLDELDLANVSLTLRLPSARMLAMRGWRGALEAAARQSNRYSLTITPRCPRPEHDGPCEMLLSPAVARAAGPDEGRIENAAFHLDRLVVGGTAMLTGPARSVVDLVAPLAFHLLPIELRGDLAFLRDTGLADCVLASRYLVEEARARDIPARFSYGVFLATPYSVDHCWAEFQVDERWLAFDPHLLSTLCRLGLLDPAVWPPYRSLSDAAWRVHDDDIPMVTDRGVRALLTLPTRRVSEGAGRTRPAGEGVLV